MINKFQNSGILKRVAHTINEHGNKKTVPHIYGSTLSLLNPVAKSITILTNKELPKITRNQNAAANSIAGTAVSFVPEIGPIIGNIMSIPDKIYDWAAAIDKPKNSNTAHVVLDYPELLGKIIPGKIDDVVLKVGNLAANVDDAASAGDKNIFEFLDSPEKRYVSKFTEPKIQVDNTYVHRPQFKQGGILKLVESGKSGIHIKPENKGKLTKLKKRTGKSEAELWKEGNPSVRKMITFARNARKWKH